MSSLSTHPFGWSGAVSPNGAHGGIPGVLCAWAIFCTKILGILFPDGSSLGLQGDHFCPLTETASGGTWPEADNLQYNSKQAKAKEESTDENRLIQLTKTTMLIRQATQREICIDGQRR